MAVRYGIVKFMKNAKIGTIMPWSGDGNTGFALSNIPQGWIVCDGRLQDAARYPLLASIIGDTYGADTAFTGEFPEFEGKFRVPNMTLQMPIDLEPDYLNQPEYQYGQTDAYDVLVTNTYTGNALVGGFGSISLNAPIPITINANCDIDFTVDPSLVMSGKFTNITIAPPDFSTTVYTINRKLGINHTPGHSHPGTYSRAQAQFAGPHPFEPSGITTGGGVSGNCVSDYGYSECQLTNAATAPSWQQGRNLITYYGDEQHEFTLPTTDRFYNFEGSTYWSQVPAASWPPAQSHPSGLVKANDLQYQFNGSAYTATYDVPVPNKNHQQPAWSGLFPKPLEVANRRNYFGPTTNYDPDTAPPYTVTNVSISPTTSSIDLPAGTDLNSAPSGEFALDNIVPFMWVYLDGVVAPGTQIVAISREGSNSANYVYTLDLSQPTVNSTALTGQTLSFKHGTYPTTTNNITSQLDPNSSSFLGHNHGSFEMIQSRGSLAAPTVFAVNNISLGTVAPENIDDALNIIAEVSMPALVTTFLIKAF